MLAYEVVVRFCGGQGKNIHISGVNLISKLCEVVVVIAVDIVTTRPLMVPRTYSNLFQFQQCLLLCLQTGFYSSSSNVYCCALSARDVLHSSHITTTVVNMFLKYTGTIL